ncbi:MAG: histone deacetylase family protein [Alphaproteobacteria bacterium]|nr:histone deacetylase family protein [Alphaproteobacteria bacterium]MDX5369380.1 histone deacetylase family protein [Alphaproteobacteria bacterium]MDX5464061.1 histone deacetylase family protein [Alphaproteobacteria bacterium]
MTTALFTHPACLAHETPPGHPERVARLQAVLRALDDPRFAALERREAPLARVDEIALAHPREHVTALLARVPETGFAPLDADTIACPGTGEAALRAAGAVIAAADAVMAGEADNAFCAIRPPGHHAEPRTAMGFCLFNNVAVAAHHLRMVHGLHRIAVIDWDVHHGNGTQAIFEHDHALFYGSTHQMPLYPGTGAAQERGVAGNIVNVPLPPGAGSDQFREAFETLLDRLERFEPEFILLSAGFDAHADDPLADMALSEADFAWATREIMEVAERYCGGRLVSALEGGYDLDALARSAAAHVAALMRLG